MVEAYSAGLLVRPHWVYLRMPTANGKAVRFVAVEVGPSSSRTLSAPEVRCAERVLTVSYLEVIVGVVVREGSEH